MTALQALIAVVVYTALGATTAIAVLRSRGWAPRDRYRFRWVCPNQCGTWFVVSHPTDLGIAAHHVDVAAGDHLARCPKADA